MFGTRSRFAKPRSAHIALQKANIFAAQVATVFEIPKQQCTSGLALPLYQMRAPIIRAKKSKILDILTGQNSAPKVKRNRITKAYYFNMTCALQGMHDTT
ncbi:MAG: hypothetical protein DBY27_04785 [Clostridiaceae bacterium]|nr:MAG: hypothetical protein DBY27_04785 [Clostridiaceae bacterium]